MRQRPNPFGVLDLDRYRHKGLLASAGVVPYDR
jgi:hypothetical protein